MAVLAHRGADGDVDFFYTVSRDITERKRAEQALRDERDRAQRYLDTADVILLKLDLEGRIVLVNRYGCSLLGWTADELLGRDWIETCLPVRIGKSSMRSVDSCSAEICRSSRIPSSPSPARNA